MSNEVAATSPTAVFGPGGPRMPGRAAMKAISVDATSFPRQSGFEATDAIIMMVDDELLNIEMTQAFLEEAGWKNFVSTHESEHAIELMRRERPHVLLLDLSMPKVSGLDILEMLRDDGELRHIPVIVLTSNIDSPTKLKALGLGAMDFLAKPVDPSELGLRLRNTLSATAHREYLAQHDSLTGLRNRACYIQDVQAAVKLAAERRHRCAVLHLGVDRLSQVNDALGRAAGDALLQRMGRRLRQAVESSGGELAPTEEHMPGIYRFDGDEFAILVPFLDEVESAAGLISSLLESANASFKTSDREVLVTASLGVAVFPLDARTPDELVSNAGLALRQAKESGRNTYEFFSKDLNEKAVNTLRVGGDLRRALGRDAMQVLYQPKIDVRTGELMGAETVLRWERSSGDIIEGNAVLQMAHTSEMSMVLAEWMFDHINTQTRAWQEAGIKVVPFGVNLSLRQFPLPQLMEVVAVALKSGGQPQFLCIELNDVAVLDDLEISTRVLGKIREWGVRVSIDQFGTGQSTLSHLQGLVIDEIKSAPSFMAKIDDSKVNAAIMQALAGMARNLGITLVATGIQTLPQLAFLKNNGVSQCQGRLFNNPMPAAEFEARWLKRG